MKTKSKDLIVLLGAGASVEAGIPASAKMIDEIEKLLLTEEWKGFKDLYHHIKAAIHYAAGIKGRFKDNVSYNIETLVNTLYELERNEEHPIYPFVAAWNSRMMSYAGADFGEVCKFRKQILRALKGWVQLESPDKASYYSGLRALQRALQFPLKVFSLNYDLCVEGLAAHDFRVETGFSGVGEGHRWEWKRFDETDPEAELPEIYLYKMHGSINWRRDDTGNLIWVNHTDNILPDKMQVIFGRDFKLEAADPYLFYAFEFRRCSLEARAILVIGYGFSDEHINKMLSQALRHDAVKRLIVVGNVRDKERVEQRRQEIAAKLGTQDHTIVVLEGTAKEFLARNDLVNETSKYMPEDTKAEF